MPIADSRTQHVMSFFEQIELQALAYDFRSIKIDSRRSLDVESINGVLQIVKGYSHITAQE